MPDSPDAPDLHQVGVGHLCPLLIQKSDDIVCDYVYVTAGGDSLADDCRNKLVVLQNRRPACGDSFPWPVDRLGIPHPFYCHIASFPPPTCFSL